MSNIRNRIRRLEANKSDMPNTAIVRLPAGLNEADERDCIALVTRELTEPFDVMVLPEPEGTAPLLLWFGDLGALLEHVAANSTRIGAAS